MHTGQQDGMDNHGPTFLYQGPKLFEDLTPFWGALEIGATGSTLAILL